VPPSAAVWLLSVCWGEELGGLLQRLAIWLRCVRAHHRSPAWLPGGQACIVPAPLHPSHARARGGAGRRRAREQRAGGG
jgi:hypothetical protein